MSSNSSSVSTPEQSTVRVPAIAVESLTKRYGGRAVVDNISFTVSTGEVFAILGPNGAGKTTTIEILEGYRAADSGTARVLGLDPRRQKTALLRRVGLMLQGGGFYPTTTPREAIHLFASFYETALDPNALIRRLGLESVQRTAYRRLSGGEKQRMSLAVALVGQPELVFLDEPTAGMDPRARRETWEIIQSLRANGVTVVLTTHFIDEAERLADRVAIVDAGRLIALGSPTELTAAHRDRQVTLRLTDPVPLSDFERLRTVTATSMTATGEFILETDSTSDLLVELTTWLRLIRAVPREIRVGGGSLEDTFLKLTGKGLEE